MCVYNQLQDFRLLSRSKRETTDSLIENNSITSLSELRLVRYDFLRPTSSHVYQLPAGLWAVLHSALILEAALPPCKY